MHFCQKTETPSRTVSTVTSQDTPVSVGVPHQLSTSHVPSSLIGVVVDDPHSVYVPHQDQVVIEFSANNNKTARVTAEVSRGLNVAPGDRVLFVTPGNSTLAVITSVLSPAKRETTCDARVSGASMSQHKPAGQELILRDSESLCVTTSSGQTLVAIERGAGGPIIRLGEGSLELDMPGELHLRADSLRFTTRNGPISIQSESDDVVVQGRTIRLN